MKNFNIITPQINLTIKFDNIIIDLNSFRKMGKIVKKALFKREKIGSSRSKQEFQIQEQNFTLPSVSSPKNNQNMIFAWIDQKTAKIIKQRKKRDFNPQGKFLPEHKKRYYLFPFFYSTQFPCCKISWENWKPNGYFVKMGEFLSNVDSATPNKTTLQCKSFDQRQKKEVHPFEDLLQAGLQELLLIQSDPFVRSYLTNFLKKMDEKSTYTQFISNDYLFDLEDLSGEVVTKKDASRESSRDKLNEDAINEEIDEFFFQSSNDME